MARITSTPAQRAGDEAEALVATRLAAAGWTILARNLRLGRDELDLVAVDPGPPPALVVVEVRRRGRRDYGLAEETPGPPQARRPAARDRGAAGGGALPDGTALPPLPLRVDLVAVDRGPDGGTAVRHHRGIRPVGRSRTGPCATLPAAAEPPRRATPVPGRTRPGAHTRITSPIGTVPTDRPLRRHQAPAGIRGGTNRRRTFVPTVSMRQLLEAGVHFGHQTRRWNPKMKPYIFAERNGIHIIDLAQTVKRLDSALEFVTETVARGDSVLFVGTKKQAQEPVMQEAMRAGQPYVTKRWLGGMMTNFVTIKKRIGLLDQLEARQLAGDFNRLPKKEAALLTEELNKPPGHARRHPQDEAPPGRDLHRRPAPRAHRRHRGEQARDPGRRHGRHQRRPGRARLHHPGQRRRDPVDPAALPAGRRRRDRGSGPARGRAASEPEVQEIAPADEPEFDESAAADLVAQLAAGGTLSFDPDMDDEDLLPGAPKADGPPRTRSPPRADATAPDAPAPGPQPAGRRRRATDGDRTPRARPDRAPHTTGATQTWRSLPRPSRTFASAPAPA